MSEQAPKRLKAWATSVPRGEIRPEDLMYCLQGSDFSDCGWILVGEAEITLHLEGADSIVEKSVAMMRAAAEKVQADAQAKVTEINRQINELLALPMAQKAA